MSVLKLNVINRVFLLFFSLSSIVNAELWHVKSVHGGEKSYPFFYKEFEGIDLESSKIIKSSVESPRIPAILEPEGYVLEAKKIEQNNSNKNAVEKLKSIVIQIEKNLIKEDTSSTSINIPLGSLVVDTKEGAYLCEFWLNDKKVILLLCSKLSGKLLFNRKNYFIGEFADTESANALKIIHTSDTKFIYKTFEDYFNVDEK